ncbi:MAG: protein-glutamate O-methyltransferase CheR, partial [Coriobacteriia bacterium]|nr:protein-glutamate O-methyltransferase CheR [Coriobacteriia bacterium]
MPGDGASLSKNLTPAEFTRFRDYIHQHSGIYLEEMKVDSLRISLITRATRFGFCTLDEYYRLLTTDEAEFKELMNLVTINETSFFRFPAQFDALRDIVIPEVVDGKSDTQRTFRVWSAGCSTGEEPYSIAMTLLDSGLEGLGYDVQVLGTDVSTNALRKAKEGVYPARALLSVPHAVATRFFEPTATGHRVTDRARSLIEFQYHNLIKEPYPLGLMGNWDVIFCRNVTIYFKLESTRRVVQNFYDSLNPGGYLFIGHSETLTSISDQFEPVELGGVFLYRRPRPRRRSTAWLPERGAAQRGLGPSKRIETRAERRARVDSLPGSRLAPSGEDRASAEEEPQAPTLLDQARTASSDGRPR